jgi:DNA-binding SARP family transcriptional activator/TolB-like protein
MNKPIQTGTRMRLSCLGQLRLQDQAGNELTPRTRKARALLAVIALSGRPCSRERLADLLWSDRGADQARASFRQAIFELRHLGNAAAAVTSPVRDTVSLNGEMITTDLWAIRSAAAADDFECLVALLSASEAGLLTDLDGLDPELDAWLHVERAHEPSRTLAAAVAAAERCLDQAGPQVANGIVAEVQRLDPSSEEAARLAMRIAHRQGDSGSLHRHFEVLRERLRGDFDAEPSRETQELFRELSDRATPPQPASGEPDAGDVLAATPAPAAIPPTPHGLTKRWALAIPALAVLAGLGAVAWKPAAGPASPVEPPLVAVLPFEQYPKGDGSLADGLWEDTRSLLSQNGTVRVLGRTTSQAIADDNLTPKAYHDRLGVAYILDGSVQRQGDRVRVNVSLTRTSDGARVWGQSFDGRLGDPFALQGAIAQGIEGRIRGRLARGGGTRAEQIATTPEVYALYSEARALLNERGHNQVREATQLLRRAVALDPNFAPAWAALGTALYFGLSSPENGAKKRDEAKAFVRRAIALAPNLSQAHAMLAVVDGGRSPQSERALEQAVALDPGNSDAWNWLGNARNDQFRRKDAIAAYARAFEIDPLLTPAVANLAVTLAELGDQPAIDRLLERISRAGGDRQFILSVRATTGYVGGDYSAAIRPMLDIRGDMPSRWSGNVQNAMSEGLYRLGYQDEAARLLSYPPWVGPMLRSERLPPNPIPGMPISARDFWLSEYWPLFAGRAMLNLGRAADLVDKYRRGFGSRDEFVVVLGENGSLVAIAPTIAVALRSGGEDLEASHLLDAAEKRVGEGMKNAPGDRELLWELGRIRGAQGRNEEAIALISRAIGLGWMPDGRRYALDLAQDPPLWALRGDPRFKALRGRILSHIARERAELGPVKV